MTAISCPSTAVRRPALFPRRAEVRYSKNVLDQPAPNLFGYIPPGSLILAFETN